MFGRGDDDDISPEEEIPDEVLFTQSWLQSIISEKRLIELALEARPSCDVCHQAVHVNVTAFRTSPHIS